MKKILLPALALAMMLVAPQETEAQGFLKKLKDKAEQQVTNAILGKEKTTQAAKPTATATGQSDTDNEGPAYLADYASSLMDKQDLGGRVKLTSLLDIADEDEEEKALPEVSFSNLFASRPAYISAKTVLSSGYDKITDSMKPVYNQYRGAAALYAKYSMKLQEMLLKQSADAGIKGGDKYAKIGQDIMAAMQAKGINPAKASEAQMTDIVAEIMGKKLGIPKDEFKKAITMGEEEGMKYLLAKYPEAEAKAKALGFTEGSVNSDQNKISKYNDYLLELQKLQKIELKDLSQTMIGTRDSIINAWEKSDTCAKVNEMEKALSVRLEKWMTDNNKGFNDAFPDWWMAARHEQNVLINDWNARQINRWNAAMQKQEADMVAVVKRVAEIDAKVDQIGGSKDDKAYYEVKSLIGVFLMDMLQYLSHPYDAIDCPLVHNVQETDGTV